MFGQGKYLIEIVAGFFQAIDEEIVAEFEDVLFVDFEEIQEERLGEQFAFIGFFDDAEESD